MVLCVDEKSQTLALLPMGLRYVEGAMHDYVRNGTMTLFAALDVATGKVIAQCSHRHRHQEFLRFLNHIEKSVPTDFEMHLVVDNYATHKHQKVTRWLTKRPRYHIHYTPTYASWLNQVEIWFNIITQKAIRRGSFRSVQQLMDRTRTFTTNYNEKTAPFAWAAAAESILSKTERLYMVISGTRH